MKPAVTRITPEPRTTRIAHPGSESGVAVLRPRRRGSRPGIKGAIIVHVIVSAAYGEDVVVDEGVVEVRVVPRRGDGFPPVAAGDLVVFALRVLRERDVDERHVHMDVAVFGVLLFEAFGCAGEPVDLGLFDPVVALIFLLVGGEGVRVEEVDC